MKLESIVTQSSAERTRITGKVSYQGNRFDPEEYWFEFPSTLENNLSKSGNPWILFLLPLAITLEEDLYIYEAVDKQLLINLNRLMKIWCEWYPRYKPIQLHVKSVFEKKIKADSQVAFFSGGVDSFFTLLHEADFEDQNKKIDDLVYIEGFDIPLNNEESLELLKQQIKNTSDQSNTKFYSIRTNLRETLWRNSDWPKLSHGCALSGVIHFLEDTYNTVWTGSTGGFHNLSFWGSHIITDPLLSSDSLEFIHDGALFTRFEKIRFIADNELVQNNLHVCWKEQSHHNCSNCIKCFRTMIILDLFGYANKFPAFDWDKYSLDKLKKLDIATPFEESHMKLIINYAKENARDDIARNIQKSLNRRAIIRKRKSIANFISSKIISKIPFFWQYKGKVHSLLMPDLIS